MPVTDEAKRASIIAKISQKIVSKLPKENAPYVCKFLEKFYANVSLKDLETYALADLYGAVLSCWNFAYTRKPEEAKVRVFNPNFETDGWESSHTIIEIVAKDRPFLVSSVVMAINQLHFTPRLIIHTDGLVIKRDPEFHLLDILHTQDLTEGMQEEVVLFIEAARHTEAQALKQLQQTLLGVIADVEVAVDDWQNMIQLVLDSQQELKKLTAHMDAEELTESLDFLTWLVSDQFAFLGVADYQLITKGHKKSLVLLKESGLGVLRDQSLGLFAKQLDSVLGTSNIPMPPESLLQIAKLGIRATIHRPNYADCVCIKRFDAQGQCIGERHVVGLFASLTYSSNPTTIPLLRKKIAYVHDKAGFKKNSHIAKALQNILDNLPRDDLFQSKPEDLVTLAIKILNLQERRRVSLFARQDELSPFISCLIYLPRDRVSTDLRIAFEKILLRAFAGAEIEYKIYFSSSMLARYHFLIYLKHPGQMKKNWDIAAIEQELIDVARSWEDDLSNNLIDYFGEEKGLQLSRRYKHAFPASYREQYTPRAAVHDIIHLESIKQPDDLALNFYKPVDELSNRMHFKIYQIGRAAPLSGMLPILECMGLHVIGGKPFQLSLEKDQVRWIHDFEMELVHSDKLDMKAVKFNFQTTFRYVWFKKIENDRFNSLVLRANLNWQEVNLIRAYAKYLQQIGSPFSQNYIEQACLNHTTIIKKLVTLFHSRFDPNCNLSSEVQTLQAELLQLFDKVAALDEDRILRRYLELILATTRTNYYQVDAHNQPKDYLSLKIASRHLTYMPQPVPMYEIFVYGAHFEGIHLRHAKVARGGLRWSDRREDFRTEVLGLMKAQVVKNAVIVPSGAKGGFVVKSLPNEASRELMQQIGIQCYQDFIRGLLDLTDNHLKDEIIAPPSVICHDKPDPYLVVAADKGTATFSDFANAISESYQFWLGDAFASGSSTGYDHKKIGITAKGAWESVKRHFRDVGIDIEHPFTVVGIGDMAGDVFGNGMLLSKHIKLIAAFNHQCIFIDPDPDPELSFKERLRLFQLPRSSWSDYQHDRLSAGGGIYSRREKSIRLSPQAQQALGLVCEQIIPSELIRAILQAPVDLLWNGGIGTFIKARSETDQEVNDKANDPVRVNAQQVRARVIAEGGNLGLTQLARAEFTLHGGRSYTDFIDNSAGVDCSDHEVNIKILLNDIVAAGEMTPKQRNQLLAEMQDKVAQLVLRNNYKQTQAITLAAQESFMHVALHSRYINDLDNSGQLDRALEYLPDDEILLKRKLQHKGLLPPEIAVLLSYSKTLLQDELLTTPLIDEPYFIKFLYKAFPEPLPTQYADFILKHSLRREIISNRLSNMVINQMGCTFIYRLQQETGASVAAIVRAYCVIKETLQVDDIWQQIESLDYKVPMDVQNTLFMIIMRLLRRVTHWFLRHHRQDFVIEEMIAYYQKPMVQFMISLPAVLSHEDLEYYQKLFKKYQKFNIPKTVCNYIAATRALQVSFDIIEAATTQQLDLKQLIEIYFYINDRFHLSWLRTEIINYKIQNHWEAQARESLRDDLDWQQRQLAVAIMQCFKPGIGVDEQMTIWIKNHQILFDRWNEAMIRLKSSNGIEFTILFVTTRNLADLARASAEYC